MADEPKPQPAPDKQPPAGAEAQGANISPAPTNVTETKPEGGPEGATKGPEVIAEPLSDGTKPTVLAPGASHRQVTKGKASITSIYRRADVLTTLMTFVGVLVAGGLVLGGYWFFTKDSVKKTETPKVTTLDKAELDKLGAFFSGNSAGNSSEVLTISASSMFKGRVAMGSDLKVVGGIDVAGPTTLGDLTVNKTSTLGVTNVRGSLTVTGPASFQAPATFTGGLTVAGNVSASGNGSFGGTLSSGVLTVRDATVSGTLNLNGHINIGGANPTAAPASSFASAATVDGNDSSGSVTVTVPPIGTTLDSGAHLATVTFRSPFPRAPHVVITPVGRSSAVVQPYILKTANNFTIGASVLPANGNASSFTFEYWVAQ